MPSAPLPETGKSQLRFLTCGSVDDGKSTLIGRLLYDAGQIFDDQIAALERDSRRRGAADGGIDFSLLVDGLEAEREQGITIDVAYRYFATDWRSFIVADTPGHEQYTRNMATGASTADLAVLLVDARKGVLVQTRRHSIICALLGIRHAVLAVNKMDLVGHDRAVFDRIVADYTAFSGPLGFASVVPIPLSARNGDHVTERSAVMGWYAGPTLLEHLETVDVAGDTSAHPLRFPVQWVNRADSGFRGFAGTVESGTVAPGDELIVASSGKRTRVARIVTFDGDLERARTGDAVTLTLADEIDVARGDLLSGPCDRPEVADRFDARILWMGEEALRVGQPYLLRVGTQTVSARVTGLRHAIMVDTLEERAVDTLALNGIGLCEIATATPVAFDPYANNRATGAFILIDPVTNQTVAAGMIRSALRGVINIHRPSMTVGRDERAALKRQTPTVLWFTGLPGAGKSTLANLVERRLHAHGLHSMLLDGDDLRFGLNRDLGFSVADRAENIRRVGEVAKLMTDAGLIVLCAFISPFRAERRMVRDLVAPGAFLEIFVDAPLEVCVARDPKGLYAKARAGLVRDVTGVDSPYEEPEAPELRLNTAADPAEALAGRVVAALVARGIVTK
jgi:bifunctional enzyme CysN/CysC